MDINDRIITFASYYDLMLAHIIRTRLEANGIQCFIADENFIWAKPYLNQAAFGVKLKIFETDLKRYQEIMAVTIIDPVEQNLPVTANEENSIIVSRFCGSADVRYGAATQFKFHWLSLLISLILFIPGYFRTAWHCFNCNRDFNRARRTV